MAHGQRSPGFHDRPNGLDVIAYRRCKQIDLVLDGEDPCVLGEQREGGITTGGVGNGGGSSRVEVAILLGELRATWQHDVHAPRRDVHEASTEMAHQSLALETLGDSGLHLRECVIPFRLVSHVPEPYPSSSERLRAPERPEAADIQTSHISIRRRRHLVRIPGRTCSWQMTTLEGVDPYKRAFLECDVAVRGHLDAGEQVVAVGRCADITELGDVGEGGKARSYVMITDRRVRLVPHYDLRHEASLDLDHITEYRERSLAHRWAIMLMHPSVEHPRMWPGRQLPADLARAFRAEGRLRDQPGPILFTELAFSGRETAAARALRGSLISRAVVRSED
jgi:hypothetical protein